MEEWALPAEEKCGQAASCLLQRRHCIGRAVCCCIAACAPALRAGDVGEEAAVGDAQGERVRGAVREAADAQALRVHVKLQAGMEDSTVRL